MKRTGRITLLSLYLLVLIIEKLLGKDLSFGEIIGDIGYGVLAWYAGRVYDKLKFIAYNDYLTKVYNRRYGNEIIPKLIQKAKIKKESVAILCLDVNNFKSLNDNYGHQMGDLALQKLSEVLLENVRRNDLVIRWGGDEFLIIAMNADRDIAEKLIDRMNLAVEAEVKKFKDQEINLGISVGYAVFPEDGINFDELLSIADKKMYRVKISTKISST